MQAVVIVTMEREYQGGVPDKTPKDTLIAKLSANTDGLPHTFCISNHKYDGDAAEFKITGGNELRLNEQFSRYKCANHAPDNVFGMKIHIRVLPEQPEPGTLVVVPLKEE